MNYIMRTFYCTGEQCKEKSAQNTKHGNTIVDVEIALAEVTPLLKVKPPNGNGTKIDL